MNTMNSNIDVTTQLRKRAEEVIYRNSLTLKEIPDHDTKKLIEELQIHQVELELQNEELRRSQLALEETRDRYSKLYDFAPIGYFTINQDLTICEANFAGGDLLGVGRSALIKKSFLSFIMPEFEEKFLLHRKRVIEKGLKQACELQLKKKNGIPFHAQLETIGIPDEAGDIIQIWTAVIDIDKRKTAETAFQKIHEELEQRVRERTIELSQKTHDLSKRLKELNCLYAISNLMQKPDLQQDEILQDIVDLIPSAWRYPEITCARITVAEKEYKTQKFKESIWKLSHDIMLHGEGAGAVEVYYGEERPGRDEGPFLNEEKDLIVAVGNQLSRIIERIKSEKERKRLQVHLQQAQKMEAVSALAGGIAHQFNNALTVIKGNLEMFELENPNDQTFAEYSHRIQNSIQRMANLTTQLLAYAKGGKYQADDLFINAFIEDILPIMRHLIGPDVHIAINLTPQMPNVKADPVQMQMLLSAILINASEAVDGKGHIRITTHVKEVDPDFVGYHPSLKPGQYTCLSIEDDGQGMTEEVKKRIFEPFFTTKQQGRGLGMAAVFGVVKNHDGWISVYSERGMGSVVRIYLPMIDAPPKPPPLIEVKSHKGGGTILIIEDEAMVRDVTRTFLENLGYRVLEAPTGKDAIHIAETFDGDIDIAILDIILPDMDGGQIYPHIMKARTELKVIICSGYSIHGPAQKILEAGAHDFIQKPFTLTEISEKIAGILKG